MNRKHLYIVLILSSLHVYYTFAQNDCEVPLPPQLDYVSVLPETSTTILNWTLSPSSDIAAYIVYFYDTRLGNPGFFAIDTLWDPLATSYSDKRPQYRSFQYRVAAFRLPTCASELSNVLSTIFVEAQIDTCERKINILWNKYIPPSPQTVSDYSILMSINGSNFNEVSRVSPETTSFILNDFISDAEYCFEVRANIEGGEYSLSNKACLTTEIQNPPLWINADYATVTAEGDISVSFSIDPASEIDLFAIERRSGFSGSFQQIAQVRTDIKSVTYTDKTAEKDVVYFYKLSAINSCNNKVVSSNMASNILLNTQSTGDVIILNWNQYHEWNGSLSSYRIYTDTGNGFIESGVTEQSDTIFTISIPEIMYTLNQGKVCFYIATTESGNPYGITGESNSNQICSDIEEVITVPNIFTPDGDLKNDLFRPVLTFSPSDYRLVISNRQGKVLFETNDFMDTWDGSYNGNPVPEGVYLWFLKIKTPTGKDIFRTGTLTVVKH
jgi:gliding motility-associated-like protein